MFLLCLVVKRFFKLKHAAIQFILNLLMGKIVCNLATSVDGFIADENGGVDWLNDFQAEDYGMIEFFEQCGTAIMGSRTYEQALLFNSWFGEMEGVVFTSRTLLSFKNE